MRLISRTYTIFQHDQISVLTQFPMDHISHSCFPFMQFAKFAELDYEIVSFFWNSLHISQEINFSETPFTS